MNLGYNPLSKIEIVSGLNVFNYASGSLAYNSENRTQKYNPRIYLSTPETIAFRWTFDRQTYAGSLIEKPKNWPQNSSQKGEANL